jgi:hypothetical protein
MTQILERQCDSATSSELQGILPDLAKSCNASPEVTAPLAGLLASADSAKFASSPIKRTVRRNHARLLGSVASSLEVSRRLLKGGRRRHSQEVADVGR